jgi:hypothetical protein
MSAGETSILWEGRPYPARILQRLPQPGQLKSFDPYPHPDVALLEAAIKDHPCVRLDQREPTLGPPPDRFLTAGFTDVFETGVVRMTPMTCEVEGMLSGGDGDRLQVKGGQVIRGMSGAPLLSERTCLVVGMITTTRRNTSDLGAWATPAAALLDGLPELGEEHERFHRGDDGWRRAAASARLADILRPAYQELPALARRAPSLLLRAAYAVVPFHERQRADELQALIEWATDPDAAGIQLLYGQAGAGKTRLAAQLCRRLEEEGWLTGFLAEQGQPEAIERIRQLAEPTLLVLDYAETRSDLPEIIHKAALQPGEEPPLRLLLLARAADDWWRQLSSQLADGEPVLAGVGVRELSPLAAQIEDRESVYQQAALAFGRAQGLPERELPRPDLRRPEFAVALHLHLAALDAVGTPEEPQSGAAALGKVTPLAAILERETRYWVRSTQ